MEPVKDRQFGSGRVQGRGAASVLLLQEESGKIKIGWTVNKLT